MKKKVIALCMAACMTAGVLTPVGVWAEDGESKYEDTITVDVFASEANYQGMQSGWYAKLVKDKFNMELNIIAPNVATSMNVATNSTK